MFTKSLKPAALIIGCAAYLLTQASVGFSQEISEPEAEKDHSADAESFKSVDQIARELGSPLNSLFFIDNDIQFRTYQGTLPGSEDQTAWSYTLAASFPFTLSNGKNIILGASLPFNLDQAIWVIDYDSPIWEPDTDYRDFRLRQSPYVTPDTGGYIAGYAHDHIDDLRLEAAYGGIGDNGFISMFGLVTVLPTSQDLSSSRDQWLLGPEIVLGKQADWGNLGVRATHLTRISGEDRWDTNETTFDIFFSYGLGNGWQLISNPQITYDWEADSGNELLLPIGGGVAKTFLAGNTPLQISAELQNFVVSSDRLGAEWLFSLRVTPVAWDRSRN